MSSRVALVTGAASGLGAGIARSLAAAGYRIAFTYRAGGTPADDTTAAIAEYDPDVLAIENDLGSFAAGQELVAAIVSKRGPLDVIVHAVGPIVVRSFAASSEADYHAMIDGNLGTSVALAAAEDRANAMIVQARETLIVDTSLLLLVVEVSVVLGFGALVFGVPLRGSLPELALLCVLGSLAFSALGLLIASRARTIEAASGLMNTVMIPMWIMSGVFFSAQRFPDFIQPVIKALPLTAVIDALRMNMLQGASLAQVTPQIGVLAGWLIVCFGLALKLFRWR